MEEKYLYGAAVQGIQSFIFQTNVLKDIVGASELVEQICHEELENYTKGKVETILSAAGNIKLIFDSKEDCQKIVKKFPERIMEIAPGITISQAVVKMEGDYAEFHNAVDELEKRLRVQRNRPMPSLTTGLMGIKRSNKTGLPAKEIKEGDYLDDATKAKRNCSGNSKNSKLCKKAFGEALLAKQFPFNIGDITSHNDWIAIIHADGNGLGQIVQKVGKNKDDFKKFSCKLEEATCKAAQDAWNAMKDDIAKCNPIPLRPVVLGGDDLTVICRADFAIEYVETFMKNFETQTENLLGDILTQHKVFDNGEKKLTACAGVAFIKSSYPFYYGYELAESLCGKAKKDAKGQNSSLAPSCVMFHKVQDSFVEDYDKIAERELKPNNYVSFEFGPYYVQDNIKDKPTIKHLLDSVEKLNSEDGNKIKTHLRQWLTDLHEDKAIAEQKRKRVLSLLPDGELKKLFRETTDMSNPKTMAYDMLALASIKYQKTK